MSKVFSDFGDLRELKRQFRADDAAEGERRPGLKPVMQQRRPRIVVNRTKAENLAAAEGIAIGTRVRMMDTSDSGVIAGFGDGWFEIESDGLVFRAQRCEFVIADADGDRKLMDAVPSRKRPCEEKRRTEVPSAEISVDLHIEKIPGADGIPSWAALDFQMNYFRQVLRGNLRYRGRRIVFIHGVGDGILASALRRELDEAFAMTCTYTYGQPGVTVVTVR